MRRRGGRSRRRRDPPEPGDLVVVPWHICCGRRDLCRAGLYAHRPLTTPRGGAVVPTRYGGGHGSPPTSKNAALYSRGPAVNLGATRLLAASSNPLAHGHRRQDAQGDLTDSFLLSSRGPILNEGRVVRTTLKEVPMITKSPAELRRARASLSAVLPNAGADAISACSSSELREPRHRRLKMANIASPV